MKYLVPILATRQNGRYFGINLCTVLMRNYGGQAIRGVIFEHRFAHILRNLGIGLPIFYVLCTHILRNFGINLPIFYVSIFHLTLLIIIPVPGGGHNLPPFLCAPRLGSRFLRRSGPVVTCGRNGGEMSLESTRIGDDLLDYPPMVRGSTLGSSIRVHSGFLGVGGGSPPTPA